MDSFVVVCENIKEAEEVLNKTFVYGTEYDNLIESISRTLTVSKVGLVIKEKGGRPSLEGTAELSLFERYGGYGPIMDMSWFKNRYKLDFSEVI